MSQNLKYQLKIHGYQEPIFADNMEIISNILAEGRKNNKAGLYYTVYRYRKDTDTYEYLHGGTI